MSYLVSLALIAGLIWICVGAAKRDAATEHGKLTETIEKLREELDKSLQINAETSGINDLSSENAALRVEVNRQRAVIQDLESAKRHLETRINRMHARGIQAD